MTILNTYPNAKTFGYIDTNYHRRNDNDIVADIDAWLYGPKALIPSGGIFFDDVLTDNADALWQMNNVASYARLDNFTELIFNPGTTPAFPDPRYPGTKTPSGVYTMANQTLVYENVWGSKYGPSTASNVSGFINGNNHGVAASRLSAMIYGLPTDATWNNVTGGCATTKSHLCTLTNNFTGVVDTLYLSDLPLVSGGGNYSAFPPDFMKWVGILAGAI
ncbi:hypothetical protein F5B20DRAFT_533742 [Whalleya microplaca]|nr:hypothetical protein F5B20DRAFT_533742 [Whalleya microplaca]